MWRQIEILVFFYRFYDWKPLRLNAWIWSGVVLIVSPLNPHCPHFCSWPSALHHILMLKLPLVGSGVKQSLPQKQITTKLDSARCWSCLRRALASWWVRLYCCCSALAAPCRLSSLLRNWETGRVLFRKCGLDSRICLRDRALCCLVTVGLNQGQSSKVSWASASSQTWLP